MRRSIFWLASALALASSSALQSQTPALDSLITLKMTDANVMGLAAAVIVDKKVVWMKGFGYADWQRTRPFMPSTVMNVASIAKPFVGVAMMRAVAAGKLSLDSDVNQYLPFRVVNPYRPAERITLRHLATHSSSITDRWEVYRQTYRFGGDPTEPLGEFLAAYFTPGGKYYAKDNFLEARPGELREYSNIGAALAGYIVERAVGAPVNVYTKRNIFTPLGMTHSGWFMREVDMKNHSTLFVSQNGQTVPILHYGGTTYPDGGLRTSVEDLSKFFIAMLNDGAFGGVRILDAPSAAEMRRFQFTDGNRPTNFPAEDGNSGLFWRTKFNGLRRGHGGNDPGVEVEMLTDESRRVGVIYFSNTSLSGTDRKATGDIFNALWKYGETQRKNP
ncbi:serine hydrolase domain-containing protein [Gemmatimonas sp.]|uniref:serine hydrolase domain-containing protein n=1 Tax=Gemmatimonas sp. TaxID=1962908 RepID=UPI00356A2023